ncbi:C4-dicarboxylate ABC transporter substrate-binding protein [Epibacterium sp. SM1979]|uniref:C4-dicarboxylate ABC transporter substrate-binding protein n=1 Tax=Tritonibacter litoralis TaxID=2662264 RepID=A0A843YJ46_9RHOB|nr:TRAP transporter substrate-binding protein [Tritonibacter litoralis]MQQ09828.1 C4-dicarboxylate ABC transporter substrate-binding protein [Tritonibacter litoralis]
MASLTNIRTAALAAVIGALGSTSAWAAEFEFKLHHFLSPKAPAHSQMLEPWAQKIMEASDGRIHIEIFPSMTLGGKPPQLPRQVRDGIVDMAWIVNAYAAGQFPRSEVFELPGVHQGDTAAVNQAMRTMYEGELSKDFKGVVALFQHVHGGQAIHMATDEVRSPADLAGKKIRIPSRTGAWIIEALGANPVKTSVGEIPVALSKKVIDGAMIPFEIIPPLKIHEQTAYQIEGPGGKRLGTTSFSVIMNEDRLNSLPADIQQIFYDNSGLEWHAKVGEIWDGADEFGINLATKSGNTHVQLSDEEWSGFETAIAPVVDRWVAEMNEKGIDGQALYDEAVKLVSENMDNN